MKIEIWSDIMCPWCYIGKARLDRAIERLGGGGHDAGGRGAGGRDDIEVVWRSFELRPDQPRTPGATLGEMMREKLGLQPGETVELFEKIRVLGEAEGLDIRLTGVRPVNSFDAQRLVHLAAESGLAHRMKSELFRAYLTDQQNVADHEVLLHTATRAGLDADAAGAVLAGDAYGEDVREDERAAARRGVTGVPTVFVDGVRVATGVPSVDQFHRALVEAG
ncbi:thioredoxin domain-containing protein [Streptomyces sp. QHH-9511]|uniref:DsbA family oxidoreductase n=1 Tax=Streptomyces sp. QHH-9511 TaxID=2684468 RepID=UPI00131607C8|nr:DsbA family oxidoreductase [Streptomyces sp. QHH-9511]QGZ49874.1 thioredoxin domain-containing protein [Streptomyces sp. QHH-9511]